MTAPTTMPMPPPVGVGRLCEERATGACTSPSLSALAIISRMISALAAAATMQKSIFVIMTGLAAASSGETLRAGVRPSPWPCPALAPRVLIVLDSLRKSFNEFAREGSTMAHLRFDIAANDLPARAAEDCFFVSKTKAKTTTKIV